MTRIISAILAIFFLGTPVGVVSAQNCPPDSSTYLPNAKLRDQICGSGADSIPVPSTSYGSTGAPSGYVASPSPNLAPPVYSPPPTPTQAREYFPNGAAASSICRTTIGACDVLTQSAPFPGMECYCKTPEGNIPGTIQK